MIRSYCIKFMTMLYQMMFWCGVNSHACKSQLTLLAVVCLRNIIHSSTLFKVVFLWVMEIL